MNSNPTFVRGSKSGSQSWNLWLESCWRPHHLAFLKGPAFGCERCGASEGGITNGTCWRADVSLRTSQATSFWNEHIKSLFEILMQCEMTFRSTSQLGHWGLSQGRVQLVSFWNALMTSKVAAEALGGASRREDQEGRSCPSAGQRLRLP